MADEAKQGAQSGAGEGEGGKGKDEDASGQHAGGQGQDGGNAGAKDGADEGKPFAVFPTAEAFTARVEREAQKALKRMLGADPDEAKKGLARLKELEKAEEDRKKAAMDDKQRLELEREEARKKADAAEARATAAEREAKLTGLCAERGIRDLDYARFRIDLATKKDADQDPAEVLDALLKEDRHRVALGVDEGARTRGVTSTSGNGAPAAKDKKKDPPEGERAEKLAPEEWARRKAEWGLP